VKDAKGLDLLESLGAGRSASEVGELILDPPKQVDEPLTVTVTDHTGLSAVGQIIIYLVQK
jgi:hypothetical protein